jgi:hypothetical protein
MPEIERSDTSPKNLETGDPGWIKEPGVENPPLRSPASKPTLQGEIQQGWGYVLFIWNLSKRIRSWRNRARFVLGLILWKPILPDEQ